MIILQNRFIEIRAKGITLPGSITLPKGASGMVVFIHGSGSNRLSPRNQHVAEALQKAGLGTLLFDLLSLAEEKIDDETGALRFNIELLAGRTIDAIDWLVQQDYGMDIKLGLFGASTGAAAALVTAAERPRLIQAVVSRGGRPDLASAALPLVQVPTLFLVGQLDDEVLHFNQQAIELIPKEVEKQLQVIPGASHLFTEPGTLDEVVGKSRDWFLKYLTPEGKNLTQ